MTEEQKEEARVKARQYAEMMGETYVDPYPASDPVITNDVPKELSDAELLEIINKRSGATLSTLDDLRPKPSAEEIALREKERETAMFTYGLTSGKFKKEDYDAYQLAIANKKDLVRGDITAQLQTAFPELSPEAIQEKVANYFFENLEETDPMRLAREKEIATLSDIQIKNKYKNIVNLPKDYEQYEEGMNNKATFDRKVQATLPVYTADVTRALESLKTFNVPVPDTKNPANTVNIELGYDDQDLKEMADILLSSDQVLKAVKDGYTVEQIKEIADYALWKKHGPRFIA